MFDLLKARIIEEDQAKIWHLRKRVPDTFIYFPNQNQLILNSSMIRIYEDFGQEKNIGHGLLSFDDTSGDRGTHVDLFLNYNTPIRLDIENGQNRFLYLFYDVKKPNDYGYLNAVLDTNPAMLKMSDKMILQFVFSKENICS